MQKVIRRTLLAERQVARRKAQRAKEKAMIDSIDRRRQNAHIERQTLKMVKQERITRREDWEMGPLAPKRDVGPDALNYGASTIFEAQAPELSPDERNEVLRKLKERYLTIVVGDRVVLLEGPDRGSIGIVRSKDIRTGHITVKGLNMAEIPTPEYMRKSGIPEYSGPFITQEKPIPILSVRLVHKVRDPETGVKKDMIITKLVRSHGSYSDRHTYTANWQRMVPGHDIIIPWPKKEPKTFKAEKGDTLRAEVEARTFVPTLLRPPMPSAVIDELRGKYSIFRTRHDPEYIERKMAEDREAADKKRIAKEMRTPLQEIRAKERKLRRAQGKGKLTKGMKQRIGRFIEEKKKLLPAEQAKPLASEPVLAVDAS